MTQFCNFETLKKSRRPNQFLMLPPGFSAAADADGDSPVFGHPPARVFDVLKKIIGAEPRIDWLAEDADGHRLELVQRSKIFRFPDRISIAIVAQDGGAALAAFSRAKIGIRDFGVNKARVTRWIDTLAQELKEEGA